jgi:hypothetical protein
MIFCTTNLIGVWQGAGEGAEGQDYYVCGDWGSSAGVR